MSRLDTFERILIGPGIEAAAGADLAGRDNVERIPYLFFQGYHPDICYVLHDGRPLDGGLATYHSIIAYAAFICGRTEEQTLELYCEEIFERLGYFESWAPARAKMIDNFESVDLDIGQTFVEWCRKGSFMHTINHPHIRCLRDLAELILRRADLDIVDTSLVPHDNLMNGPVFPIYPEIGSKLGLRGDYTFKRGGGYQCFSLAEFISDSFLAYRGNPETVIQRMFETQLSRALPVIEASR